MVDQNFLFAGESGRLLEAVFESCDDAILARDLQGNILLWNRGAEWLYGYAAEDIVGKALNFIVPSDRMEEWDGVMRRLQAGEAVPAFDTVRVAKGGRRLDVSVRVSALRDAAGVVIGQVSVARDLGAALRADRALAVSEARWRSIIDSAVDGIAVIDSRGRIESFNPAAQRMFGYAASEVIGRNVTVLMPPPFAAEHDGYLRRYLETGEQHIIGMGREVFGRRKDGVVFPLHLSVGRMAIAGEVRFTGILRDLTERNAMEVRLREESALARIGELAAVLAHEIKNPLAAISGAIQMLAHHIQPGSEEQDIIKEVLQRIDGLSDLLTDLLLYARPPKPHLMVFDVRSLVESQVTFFKSDPDWRNVEVVVQAEPDAAVLADPEQIKIVLQNILVNAVQAMRHQGELRIRVERSTSGVSIDVIDAGPGMSPDVQDKAFTPFFTTKARGTGLGLATVRRIAESQGGKAEILRTSSAGTTVRVTFPPA